MKIKKRNTKKEKGHKHLHILKVPIILTLEMRIRGDRFFCLLLHSKFLSEMELPTSEGVGKRKSPKWKEYMRYRNKVGVFTMLKSIAKKLIDLLTTIGVRLYFITHSKMLMEGRGKGQF